MVINTMRRAAAFLWLALAVAVSGGSLTVDPNSARVHAERLRNTYPRPEGSPGEDLAIEYITSVLDASGIGYVVHSFSGFAEGHSFSSTIEITIPGDSVETLIIAAPLNHPEDAEPDEDRTVSVAALLAVAEGLALATPPVTCRLLILGAEFGDAYPYPMGTTAFLSRYFAEVPHAALYLDVSHPPLTMETGGSGTVAPDWLVERTADAARAEGLFPRVRPSLNQLHRLGISSAQPQMSLFLEREIPVVMLGSDVSRLTAPEVAEDAASLARVVERWVNSFPSVESRWDKQYLLFRFGESLFVLPETTYLIVLLSLVAATLLYAVIYRRQMGRYARTVGRNIWNLPLLFILVFGFLTAGTLLLELFLVVLRFPTIWQFYPTAYVALKIALSVFLFSLIAQLIRHLPLSKNGSFYSAAALFVLFIDVVLFSALSLSVGLYFVWAFVCAFLFSLTRSRLVKMLTLALSPFFLVRVAVQVLTLPELGLTSALLLSTRGDLLLAFMTLPFLLMLIRLDFLIRHPVKGHRSFALGIASLISGVVVAGLLVFVLVSRPYSEDSPQPILATEIVDYPQLSRTLTLSSPAPLGDLSVEFAGEELTAETGAREWVAESRRLPDVLSVRLSTEEFLDRDRATLTINAPQPIDSIELSFSSDTPLEIYDVSFPFTLAPDRLSARIHIGRRPDLPLVVEYTLARGTAPRIRIETVSSVHPEPLVIRGENTEVRTELIARTEFGP